MLSLCSIQHHGMKTNGGVEVHFHTFLTMLLDGGGEQAASCSTHFTPEQGNSITQTGGWT
jgi:hypothetical protein